MSEQFPPSSPLLGASEQRDVFEFSSKPEKDAGGYVRGRQAYVTPDPSSTIGRTSSPPASSRSEDSPLSVGKTVLGGTGQHKANTTTTSRVTINKDFNILDPQKDVLRIPFYESNNKVLVGRSSKSCDFSVPSPDMTISRIHLAVSYSSEQIVVNCLGHNGFGIHIPRPCLVYSTNVSNSYVVIENTGNITLPSQSLKKSIKLNSDYTEFTVNRDESIILPRVNNILIEIRNKLVLLNPLDDEEELTEDEEPVLLHATTKQKFVSPVRQSSVPPVPTKKDVASPLNILERKLQDPISFEHAPTLAKPVSHEEGNREKMRSVLSDKTNTSSYPSSPIVKQDQIKRKAQSEEPPNTDAVQRKPELTKRKKKREEKTAPQQPVKVDQSSIENIGNVSEINNILINHLAFSRLSSTPASFLNTISASTSKLSLKQIRTLLHNIECIGTIYREGKDAAGKPLEEEYYYIPEKDIDEDRTRLVESIKGHGGLRSCRRTHKQYYWKKPAPIKK